MYPIILPDNLQLFLFVLNTAPIILLFSFPENWSISIVVKSKRITQGNNDASQREAMHETREYSKEGPRCIDTRLANNLPIVIPHT